MTAPTPKPGSSAEPASPSTAPSSPAVPTGAFGGAVLTSVPQPWPKLATAAAVALLLLGLAWELLLDPLRPGGSWLALKVLPLAIALPGLWRGKPYTFKWMSLMIWFYVGEALVRVAGLTPVERLLAWHYLALSVVLSVAVMWGAKAFRVAASRN
jgi:uncharacterized membrane protein